MSDPADFVGRGIAWPLGVDQTGSIATSAGVDGIASALRMILSTAPGERTMRPEFGCRIWNLLFEPINANTMGLMADAVREAVSRWEPRIELDDVRVEPDQSAEGKVTIFLDYHTKTTNDRRNLVFPFYVIPLEGES
ncbi:MAG: GPW/gp25 family protein [Ilumatobacter fluminis]|uniref:GPW/gp25 family protein n=1 Tax=Ilumatobacter fluminis TaxID=467091 RepID=UPI0032F0628D